MKHLKLLLRSLVSNNACVEAARTREKKYNIIAVVFALVALFFSVLPMTVTNLQQRGSAWVSSEITYNFKPGLYNFCYTAENGGAKITINSDKTLTISQGKNVFVDGEKDVTLSEDEKTQVTWNYTNVKYYHYTNGEDTEYDSIRCLEVYDLTEDKDDKTFNDHVTALLNNTNPWASEDEEHPEKKWLQYKQTRKETTEDFGDPVKLARSTSCIFFGKKNIYGYIFQRGNSSIMGSVGGDYLSTPNGDLFETLGIYDALATLDPAKVADKWIPFWDQVYNVTRWNGAWRSTGIMIGVNVGVLLFMGLMVFLLTRGKNNPFRIYSFWDCQKISYYCSLTAGLIALFGFLLKPLAMMMFVLILGVRVMWCSMRTLRYTPAPK
ncbi:MAG: hypothetical protein MJ207_00975 [Bacilli bacterium]|nr:hypothetical protein [Bacilli bacterium]